MKGQSTPRLTSTAVVSVSLLFCFLLSALPSWGQTRYQRAKALLSSEGYTVCEDKYANLTKGQTGVLYRTFYPNTSYIVYAFSNDDNVKDVDVYVYYSDGSLFTKDQDDSNVAAVTVNVYTQRYMKVEFKNYDSYTPDDGSTVRVLVAYK